MLFNALLPAYLAVDDGDISLRAAFFMWFLFSAFYMRILAWWMIKHSRSHEFLCDLSAARRYGILNVINGLLGVVKTAEIQYHLYTTLLNRIRKDDTLSIEHLQNLLAQCEAKLPDRAVTKNELLNILREVLNSDATDELRDQLSREAQKKEEEKIRELLDKLLANHEFDLIDWNDFDTEVKDGRISRNEYGKLIATLIDDPDQQLFDLPSDNKILVQEGTHPTVRDRILFLEKCKRSDPTLRL